MQRNFLFILGSARQNGNTENLARYAARSLPATVEQKWIHLLDHALPLFEDIRHHETQKYAIASEAERLVLDATLAATDIVVASPVYWYSVSASIKLYLDHWSAWMRLEGVDFKARMAGKTLWAVSAFSDDDPRFAQPLIDTLRLSADYMKMNWGGVLLGYGNRPADVLNDAPSLERAKKFFAEI
ncbi:MAG TPA: NAD(P)H-dependent oxidoreductase [Pyrinomonadaceae bacterium]|nr:NAD(P)H-dependent oxidoreductase [Pyrinomonadaceae bacterium]